MRRLNRALITPQDTESWKSLLNVAAIRNYEAVLDIAKTVDEGVTPRNYVSSEISKSSR